MSGESRWFSPVEDGLLVGIQGAEAAYLVAPHGVRQVGRTIADGLAPPDLPPQLPLAHRAQLPGRLREVLPLPQAEGEGLALLLAAYAAAWLLRHLVSAVPILVATGLPGSGKTTLARCLGLLLVGEGRVTVANAGPLARDQRTLPTLMASAPLLIVDNLEGRQTGSLLNSLAALTTGAATIERKLYSDDQVVRLEAHAWPIITAFSPPLERGDVATRCFLLELPPRSEFASTLVIERAVLARRRDFWQALLHDAALVLRAAAEGALEGEERVRHVEFARIGRVLARSLGREAEWDAVLEAQVVRQTGLALGDDVVLDAIFRLLERTPGHAVEETAGRLAGLLQQHGAGRWLSGPSLAAWLRANAAHLRRAGVSVEVREDRHRCQRLYRLALLPHRAPTGAGVGRELSGAGAGLLQDSCRDSCVPPYSGQESQDLPESSALSIPSLEGDRDDGQMMGDGSGGRVLRLLRHLRLLQWSGRGR
jgi:energy-coupling factor transporter ATP-binding protein EcfA2